MLDLILTLILTAIYLCVGLFVGMCLAPDYKYLNDYKRTHIQLVILTYPIWIVLILMKGTIRWLCKVM